MKNMGLIILAAALWGGVALAQDGVRYNKTTTIDFEDDTIEGDLTKPDGENIDARGRVQHSNLIRVREEFKDRVMESVGEL